jgi:putative flippase GtrA
MDIDVSLTYRFFVSFLPILIYSFIGVMNTFIDFTLFSVLCFSYQISAWKANMVSYSVAVIFSFFTNRRFTFRSASNSCSRTIDQFGRFLVVSLMGLTASSLITYLLTPSVGAILAKIVAIPVTLCLGFTITRIWVFPADAATSPSCAIDTSVGR